MATIPGSDSGQARLTIESYKTVDCTGEMQNQFICQTNPKEIEYSFEIKGGAGGAGGGDTDAMGGAETPNGLSAQPPVFQGYMNMVLKFDIKADATGIVPVPKDMEGKFGTDDAPSIKEYLDLLQNTVYSYQEETHGPPYLKLIWGNIFPDSSNSEGEKKPAVYKGMIKSYEVKITLFSISGEPIKADISIVIDSLIAPDAKPLGKSPDLTHHIPIQHGDKMSTHCNNIYGRYDSKICAAVAEYNNLIDWDLEPGKQMTFPSIHLLNELYLDKYEDVELKHVEEESEYKQMVDLIGEKKAKQYFKMFPPKKEKIEA